MASRSDKREEAPVEGTDHLAAYRAKRSKNRTPEPFAERSAPSAPDAPRIFVVQKHLARRLHYDLRLELGGVLRSFAVPHGPSLDPSVKRLAVAVEDHPLEYAEFEGVIPKGEYGAGPVIVWDRGTWTPIGDPEAGLAKGKLLFELSGLKLRGRWTLVRLRKTERDWLLIREIPRGEPKPEPSEIRLPPEESILSGLTVEELGAGKRRDAEIRAILLEAGARPGRKGPPPAPMLAEACERPFSRKGFVFELKYDGFRLMAEREGADVRLFLRSGGDGTGAFPDVARAVAALPAARFVLDGEVTVLDAEGRPSFARLEKRARLERARDIAQAALELPACYFAFDLLRFEDLDLTSLPLLARKAALRKLVPPAGLIRYADHVEERGEAVFAELSRMGLEGMVGKRADSPYRSGRSGDWLKVRRERTGDFAVVGFTAPAGSRAGFGALHLAARERGGLVYAGRVGTGFSQEDLDSIRAALDPLRRRGPPCTGDAPRGRGHTWVEPTLVCEVRYKDRTEDGLLRQPAFLRMRGDKRVEECVAEGREGEGAGGAGENGEQGTGNREQGTGDRELGTGNSRGSGARGAEREVAFSNLDKVFWPEEGYTKGDLIEYYRAVSPFILPHLRDRPVVLTRYPDGIAGKSFYQKDAPHFAPAWIRRVPVWSQDTGRDIEYFVCDDEASLLYVVNLGTIPLHIWPSRAPELDRPDWCVLDLDPKGAPFANVVRVARAIHALCEDVGLPSLVKTSGSTGLHVLLPLGRGLDFRASRSLGELLARLVVAELPEIATVARQVSERGGRVYIDFLQNVQGQLLAAPFSVRPLPGAPVSTPLEWREVDSRLDPRRFTIRTVPRRLEKKGDPLGEVLALAPDLGAALERLGKRHRR